MSWYFSRAVVEAYSEANCLAGESLGQSNLTTIAGKSSWHARMTEASTRSSFGTTSFHLMGSRGADWWMWSLAVSRASESARKETTADLESALDSTTLKADLSGTNCESSEKLNRLSPDLKTTPISQSGALILSLEHLPRWGSMRSGVFYQRSKSEHPMNANGSGLKLPTPTAHNAKEGNYPGERRRKSPPLGAILGGKPNPEYTEWMMGWPIGWTDLKPLAMDKFQQWLRSHGKLSNPNP